MQDSPENLIFICVFNQTQYIEMLFLLLESIYSFGKINHKNKILIYTSTDFMKIIQKSDLNSDYIIFHTNDSYTSLDSACKARLDLFTIPCVKDFKRILYLDTDILVVKDINSVFNQIQEDKLYAVGEGNIADGRGWWGYSLFQNEINNYSDKTAFSSGILLFNNSENMISLFNNIKKDIAARPNITDFHDQPYIVYNAFKYDLINKRRLALTCAINDENIHTNKTILHFAGSPGVYEKKLHRMKDYLSAMFDIYTSDNISKSKDIINSTLLHIIHDIGEPLEGNIFMYHHTTNYTDIFINKAKNISKLVMGNNIKNVLEIGFNAGFSALLMLITNPKIHITCMDIAEHKYTMPCYYILKEIFGKRIDFIKGDTLLNLPEHNGNYDLIHIDGGHSDELVINDVEQSFRIANNKTIILMDDYDFPNIRQIWDKYIQQYNMIGISSIFFQTQYHDARIANK